MQLCKPRERNDITVINSDEQQKATAQRICFADDDERMQNISMHRVYKFESIKYPQAMAEARVLRRPSLYSKNTNGFV